MGTLLGLLFLAGILYEYHQIRRERKLMKNTPIVHEQNSLQLTLFEPEQLA